MNAAGTYYYLVAGSVLMAGCTEMPSPEELKYIANKTNKEVSVLIGQFVDGITEPDSWEKDEDEGEG